MNPRFYNYTWSDISGTTFPLNWYQELFNLHHYTMSARSLDYLKEYRQSQFWPKDKWDDYINSSFLRIVNYAYENNPFYKKYYDQHGVKMSEIKSIKDIDKLPLVDRTTLSLGTGDLSVDAALNEGQLLVKTSGSTGTRMSFICDKDQLDRRWASWIRLFEWSGWQWGDKEFRFWYQQASTVKNPKVEAFDAFLSNRHFYEFGHLDDEEVRFYCEETIRLKPYVLTGYWEAIDAVMRYAYLHKIHLPVEAILPSTQVVPPEARDLVRKVSGAKLLDKYASSEFSSIGCQCEQQNLYHVQSENVFLEVLKDGQEVKNGMGEAVVTDFHNLSTPLIRYRIRDVVEATTESCPCSRTLPVFKRPLGRLKNIVKLKERVYTELELAEFEYVLWRKKICDRIKVVQTNNNITVLVSNVADRQKLSENLEKFFKQPIKPIQVDTISPFHAKRHRGESELQNIFNN